MRIPLFRGTGATILASLAMAGAPGCGPEQPTPPGTNAPAGEVTTEGPGTRVVAQPESAPTVSTPHGGGGPGMAPPVTPAKGAPSSGESNSGQETGKTPGAGSDATTEGAKPASAAPGTAGGPPR